MVKAGELRGIVAGHSSRFRWESEGWQPQEDGCIDGSVERFHGGDVGIQAVHFPITDPDVLLELPLRNDVVGPVLDARWSNEHKITRQGILRRRIIAS